MSDTPEQSTNTEPLSLEERFRPLTRSERRTLWLKEYGEQDFALQALVRLVEQRVLEISVMFQTHGLIIFGVLVSAEAYAQFYIDQFEEMYRQQEPAAADLLRDYYMAQVPSPDELKIGPEGLPFMFRYAHLRDVTIMSAGHKITLPYWRGKINEIDAFAVGATAGE
jgi:hypothetical protein